MSDVRDRRPDDELVAVSKKLGYEIEMLRGTRTYLRVRGKPKKGD